MAKTRANLQLLIDGAKLTKKQEAAIKKRLRGFADDLWMLAVRDDWDYKCAVCGIRAGRLEAHHVIPRRFERYRYDLRNGILLCFQDHNHNDDHAPHQNAAGWMQWLHEHYPELETWYTHTMGTSALLEFYGTKNYPHYIEQIRRLKEYVDDSEFERVVGVRFAAWLEENSE